MARPGSRRTSGAGRSPGSTEETGADPARLTELLAEAKPDETLLVDDLGGWVAALLDPARQPNDDEADVAALADAVRACAARLVLVSPEVGLSLVPIDAGRAGLRRRAGHHQPGARRRLRRGGAGRRRPADLAQASADARRPSAPGRRPRRRRHAGADAASRRRAGRRGHRRRRPPPPVVAAAGRPAVGEARPQRRVEPTAPAAARPRGATMTLPLIATGHRSSSRAWTCRCPTATPARTPATASATLDLPGAGLGALGEAVEFAAATQGTATPRARGRRSASC